MTVGRYIRKLGYADLRDIKDELRAGADDISWNETEASKTTFVQATLNAKIKGVVDVHKIPESLDWPRIVSLIASAHVVHVASFHIGRFMGLGFAATLQNLRPRVYFSDGSDGCYGDILLDPDPDACLVLIDFRRYSPHFRQLAEEAAARNIKTVILTDVYCHWARGLTENVLMIETDFGIRSLSMAQLLFELLLAAIANEIAGTETRIEAIHRLRQKFTGIAGPQESQRRKKVRK